MESIDRYSTTVYIMVVRSLQYHEPGNKKISRCNGDPTCKWGFQIMQWEPHIQMGTPAKSGDPRCAVGFPDVRWGPQIVMGFPYLRWRPQIYDGVPSMQWRPQVNSGDPICAVETPYMNGVSICFLFWTAILNASQLGRQLPHTYFLHYILWIIQCSDALIWVFIHAM